MNKLNNYGQNEIKDSTVANNDLFEQIAQQTLQEEQADRQREQTASDETPTSMGQALQGTLKNLGQTAAGLGGGALSGIAEMGRGLGQIPTSAVNALLGTHLQTQPAGSQSFANLAQSMGASPTSTAIGEYLGKMGATVPMAEIPAAEMGGGFLANLLAGSGAGAATTPGSLGQRAITGLEQGALAGLLGAFRPVRSNQALAKRILGQSKRTSKEASARYDQAMQPLRDMDVNWGEALPDSLKSDLGEIYEKTNNAELKKAIREFDQNPNVDDLHSLRIDLRKAASKLEKQKEKGNVELSETQDALRTKMPNVRESITDTLESMAKEHGGSDAVDQLRAADRYYKTHRVPFKTAKGARDVTLQDKVPSNLLSQLLKEQGLEGSAPEEDVLKLINISRPQAKVGQGLQYIPASIRHGLPYVAAGLTLDRLLDLHSGSGGHY